jgi:hypothetical protein
VTVIEAEVYLPTDLDDWPVTEERDVGPFLLALLRGEQGRLSRFFRGEVAADPTLAEAPIGMWRLPSRPGDTVTSAWPAHFAGPLAAARAWELRVPPGGDPVHGNVADFPWLGKFDTLDVSVTLTGVLRPVEWWQHLS